MKIIHKPSIISTLAHQHINTSAHFFFVLLLLLGGRLLAQIPAGYYDPAQGLYGVPLKSALHNIIDGHTTVNYDDLYDHFLYTDVKPGNVVWDMYSDNPGGNPPYVFHYNSGEECGNYSQESDCYNREHSWPKSWFGGVVMPMYSDMFHLYPTDGYVNNRRSNYPFGEVGSASWTSMNGSKVGNCSWPGYSGTVFEPIDAYKGDFARSYFYMSVRYYTEDGGWPGSEMVNGADLKNWAKTMLLQWSTLDPVSQKEIDRNNLIYGIQNNRNPFIDNPQWAFDIWGAGAGTDELAGVQPLYVYPNPATTSCTVMVPSGQHNMTLDILDISGRLIQSCNPGKESTYQVDISTLQPGFYVMSLRGADLVYRAVMIRK